MKFLLFSFVKSLLKVKNHIIYWVAFVSFFTLVWGTYDNDYFRNFMIQILSLPARMILVFVTLYFLFPNYFLRRKFGRFIVSSILLLVVVSIFVQRVIFFYIIQPHYLKNFKISNFFALTEIMNTILDVNMALIIPLGYTLFKSWHRANQRTLELEKRHMEQPTDYKYIYLKIEKSLQKVYIDDIIFIESLKNYIKVKTIEREIIVYKSISDVKELLPKRKFLRVHRSYIVALDFIDSFSPSKLTLKGISIPVGRKYKEEVKNVLGYF